MSLVELTPEQQLQRTVIRKLKEDIKEAVQPLREQKRYVSSFQKIHGPGSCAVDQSNLARNRRIARARYLVYGLIRGRTWDQIEPNHPEQMVGLKYFMNAIWIGVQRDLPGDATLAAPEALQPWLLR